jgi:hypothetical protein
MPPPVTSLAFYLPQFHTIPENDAWWGKGFTEWTHLRSAPRYSRKQVIRRPVPPLGEYSLDDAGTLEAQWDLAADHGIDGFAVWDYWFGAGKQLLERPIERVLRDKLRFRYCLAWANHSWYDKSRGLLLCEQQYLGAEDYARYFERACRHFETDNYVKIDGKPVFIIFLAYEVPDFERFAEQWRELARQRGFPGLYLVACHLWEESSLIAHVDKYSNGFRFLRRRHRLIVNYLKEQLPLSLQAKVGPRWYDFRRMEGDTIPRQAIGKFAPTVLTGWDTTPRHGRRGAVYRHLDVESFKRQLAASAEHIAAHPETPGLLFLKSWNEWAEGNILEPDDVYGMQWLEAFRDFRSSMAPAHSAL